MKNQAEQVMEAMRQNGGYAKLGDLYRWLDFSSWGDEDTSCKRAENSAEASRFL
jgi:hypothetical protein